MDKIMGIVRAAVAAGGGFLVALGVMDSDTAAGAVTNVETILGSVTVVLAAAASLYAKIKGVIGK